MTNRKRITDQQLDTMIEMTDEKLALTRQRLAQVGMTPDEFNTMDEQLERDHTPFGVGSDIELYGATYIVESITNGRASLRRLDTDKTRRDRFH